MKSGIGVWGIWNDTGERWVQVHELGPYTQLTSKQVLALIPALEAAAKWAEVPPVWKRKQLEQEARSR